jgi:hypothetical protein
MSAVGLPESDPDFERGRERIGALIAAGRTGGPR